MSPAASQSLSSLISCSSAQLYPASCPLQSDVQGDPSKVEEVGSAAEASSDSFAEELEVEGIDVTAGVPPTSVLEWVNNKNNPTAMIIAQITFLPKGSPLPVLPIAHEAAIVWMWALCFFTAHWKIPPQDVSALHSRHSGR